MTRQKSAIDIFRYSDYRSYLRDYYKERKARQTSFSYRFFARRAGINSVGLFKDVIEGRQSLGRGLVAKFSKGMGHSKREAEYFENMVFFCEAGSAEERNRYLEKMLAVCGPAASIVDSARFEYYSQWFYGAVRAVLTYSKFDGDYKRLAGSIDPPISAEQARNAVAILEELSFIKKENDGVYTITEPSVTTGRLSEDARVRAVNVIRYQRHITELGNGAYDRFPLDTIDMSTLTLSISRETYFAMKEEIGNLRAKLAHMARDDAGADRVYQLNYQFFPLTKLNPEERRP